MWVWGDDVGYNVWIWAAGRIFPGTVSSAVFLTFVLTDCGARVCLCVLVSVS